MVFLARGLGAGLLPLGPGTWGSVVGLAWFGGLLWLGNPWVFGVGLILGLGLSVWVCGRAAVVLLDSDPSSVVMDEIVAMPLCFLALLVRTSLREGFPNLFEFIHEWPPWLVPAVFAAFRLLDIWKPWPIRQVQSLPGGWGIVADDVLAAGGVSLLTLVLGR